MRVGISVLTHAQQSIWENGLGQAVFFLAQLLRTLPLVSDVVLLNGGDQERVPPEAEAALPGLRLVPPRDATDLIDVAIEMGADLDTEWLDHLRALGKKVVHFCGRQAYAGLVEPALFKRPGHFSRARRCDEVWTFRSNRLFKPMLETLHRCPVHEVPFLWHPAFVEQRAAFVASAGFRFGYQPIRPEQPRRALRVAVFEPNVSVSRCCAMPMLVCDAAYRAEPEAIAQLNVLNSIQLKAHPTFACLTRSLRLHEHQKVHLDHRHDFVGYMSQFADAVVTHQSHDELSLLHLDALHGGYPLVHNAPWLADLGYYYAESDVEAGGRQLRRAAREHDAGHADTLRRNRAFLAGLSPSSADNGMPYAHRLLRLAARPASRVALC